MPIYAYQCQACGQSLEVLRKISDPPLSDCPGCGKAELMKLLTAPSFRLGGSGWYETDFKTGNKKNLAGEQGGDSAAASKTADGGSGAADGATAPA